MPYKNILWIKLEKRLLNDSRFFLMSEKSQLIYVKLLMIAAETDNKIPTNTRVIKLLLRTSLRRVDVSNSLKEIGQHFPKFKKIGLFYTFLEWENRVNQVRTGLPQDSPGIAQGKPAEGHREEKRRIDKIREEEKIPPSLKPYYNGMQLRESNGRLWCIPKGGGKWYEFVGKTKDITWL